MIKVAFIDGIKEIPLTPETMKTMSNFFELKKGVFYFSKKKQKKFLKIS
jgi:hypothetical protein